MSDLEDDNEIAAAWLEHPLTVAGINELAGIAEAALQETLDKAEDGTAQELAAASSRYATALRAIHTFTGMRMVPVVKLERRQ